VEISAEDISRISEFTFPYLNTEHEYRYITVVQRGRQGEDRWAILDSPHCYNRVTEIWEYEMRPSERDDEWMAQTRMPLAEAIPLAHRLSAERKTLALSRISQILVLRVKRARETDDPRLKEYEQDLAKWRAERKELEEQ
jgi:hypothetical protein